MYLKDLSGMLYMSPATLLGFFYTVYPFEGTDTSVYYGLYCRVLEFARCTVISDSLARHAMLSDYPIG